MMRLKGQQHDSAVLDNHPLASSDRSSVTVTVEATQSHVGPTALTTTALFGPPH